MSTRRAACPLACCPWRRDAATQLHIFCSSCLRAHGHADPAKAPLVFLMLAREAATCCWAYIVFAAVLSERVHLCGPKQTAARELRVSCTLTRRCVVPLGLPACCCSITLADLTQRCLVLAARQGAGAAAQAAAPVPAPGTHAVLLHSVRVRRGRIRRGLARAAPPDAVPAGPRAAGIWRLEGHRCVNNTSAPSCHI